MTDFAVGIGGFSVGTEVRIPPPSRSTVCYFKQSPLEPTLLSSERVFITPAHTPRTPPPLPNTNTGEVLALAAMSPFPYTEQFSKENTLSVLFYVWEGVRGGDGVACCKRRN